MTMKGGNTDELYKNGRLEFVKSLQKQHPNEVKITKKYGRWHHHVDYKQFKNKLIKKPSLVIKKGVNNYGMVLKKIK